MLTILPITFPIFALVGLGYGLTYLKVFDRIQLSAIGNFVMLLALPLLLFHATATKSFGELIDPGFMGLLICAGLVNQLLIWTVLRLRGLGPGRRAIGVLGASTPNSAFLAFPILSMVFPEQAPAILAMCLLNENFLMNPIGLMLVEAARPHDQAPVWKRIGQLILSVLRRPMILGLAIGALWSVLGLPLPRMIEHPIDMISSTASPLALFFMGGQLVGLPVRGNIRLAGVITLFKLVIHPLVAFGLLSLFALLALPVPASPQLATGLILSTAMPVFGMFPLLSQGSGHEGAASLTVMVCTVSAFFTLTALLALLL
ncbi:AEC family transporter [Pseudooceanicola sp. CBS1P-1]|uniref:Transporter n=1 Tax=Pseudooceanicola albus TaxID=2692189 RepID=A0A6L7FY83_9RHOB|nr:MULTISPECIES: AEC family transporter [Pseudooceanicola]MBT9383948.1 AEC family transporter [Pseudooceanicola endophyticus]MXN16639.1 transporter [Pseudooceanicola albus]